MHARRSVPLFAVPLLILFTTCSDMPISPDSLSPTFAAKCGTPPCGKGSGGDDGDVTSSVYRITSVGSDLAGDPKGQLSDLTRDKADRIAVSTFWMDFTFFRDAAGPFGPSGVVCFPDAVVQGALEVSQSNADPTASTTKYEFSGFTKNGKQASYSLTLEGVIDDPARWLPAGSEAATITGGSWRMKAKGGNVCSGEGTLAFVITIAGGFQVFVANGGPNTASVIATAGNSVVSTVGAGNQPRGAAVSPLGDVAYIANDASDDVTVIDAENHSVLTTIPVGQFPVSVAFTPDGSHAYVTNRDDNTVSVIETAGRTVVKTIGVGTHPLGAAVTPNGAFAYVANNISGNVSVISTETNTVVQTIPVGGYLFGIAIGTTANGVYAYVVRRDNDTVVFIDTGTNTVLGAVPVGDFPAYVALSPDGELAYATNRNDDTVTAITTATNTVLATIGVGNFPVEVAFTPDGERAYVTNRDAASISVIDVATHTETGTVGVGTLPRGVAVSPLP